MNRRFTHTLAATTLLAMLAFQTQQHARGVRAAPPPQVIVRRVSTLDGRGHQTGTFRAGNKIELRIQWVVRHASTGAQQAVEWTVLYAGHPVFHIARRSGARNGSWVRIATATISRRPNFGPHTFRARVSVAGTTAERSVVFTVQG